MERQFVYQPTEFDKRVGKRTGKLVRKSGIRIGEDGLEIFEDYFSDKSSIVSGQQSKHQIQKITFDSDVQSEIQSEEKILKQSNASQKQNIKQTSKLDYNKMIGIFDSDEDSKQKIIQPIKQKHDSPLKTEFQAVNHGKLSLDLKNLSIIQQNNNDKSDFLSNQKSFLYQFGGRASKDFSEQKHAEIPRKTENQIKEQNLEERKILDMKLLEIKNQGSKKMQQQIQQIMQESDQKDKNEKIQNISYSSFSLSESDKSIQYNLGGKDAKSKNKEQDQVTKQFDQIIQNNSQKVINIKDIDDIEIIPDKQKMESDLIQHQQLQKINLKPIEKKVENQQEKNLILEEQNNKLKNKKIKQKQPEKILEKQKNSIINETNSEISLQVEQQHYQEVNEYSQNDSIQQIQILDDKIEEIPQNVQIKQAPPQVQQENIINKRPRKYVQQENIINQKTRTPQRQKKEEIIHIKTKQTPPQLQKEEIKDKKEKKEKKIKQKGKKKQTKSVDIVPEEKIKINKKIVSKTKSNDSKQIKISKNKDKKLLPNTKFKHLIFDKIYGTKDYDINPRSDTTFGLGRYPDRTRTRPLLPWLGEAVIMSGSNIVGVRAANKNYQLQPNYKDWPKMQYIQKRLQINNQVQKPKILSQKVIPEVPEPPTTSKKNQDNTQDALMIQLKKCINIEFDVCDVEWVGENNNYINFMLCIPKRTQQNDIILQDYQAIEMHMRQCGKNSFEVLCEGRRKILNPGDYFSIKADTEFSFDNFHSSQAEILFKIKK